MRSCLEPLERRDLLSVAGTDYAFSGYTWTNPSRVTYSIAPDGVFWDHGVNNLHAVFDAKFGPGRWERELARALATWQAATNLNIAQVPDSPIDLDAIGQAQGDTRFGDIRFGGYAFASTTTLAQTFYPPPNGWTAAGDVEVNTSMAFGIGSDFDLFSVMLHETGHALGLEHPSDPAEVMGARYGGVRAGLSTGDLDGIQSLYGARQPDPYRMRGVGGDLGHAIDVSGGLSTTGQATISGVSLSTIGDTEYFSVVAPAGAAGALRVTASANGTSLLSPRISLLDASGRPIDTQADPSGWGVDVTAQAGQVAPGQRYYVAVTGATSDVFAVGAYVLKVDFTGVRPLAPPATPTPPPPLPPPVNPTPPVPPPPVAPTIAPDRFEPNDAGRAATPLGVVDQTTLDGLSLTTAADVDTFAARNARAGTFVVTARGTSLRLVDSRGRILAQGNDQVSLRLTRAQSVLQIQVRAPGGSGVASYVLGLSCVAPVPTTPTKPAPRRPGIAPPPSTTPMPRATPTGPAGRFAVRPRAGAPRTTVQGAAQPRVVWRRA